MDVLGTIGTVLVAAAVLIPGAALVSLILRASRETANATLLLLAFGVTALLIGGAVYVILQGVASIRQAQHAKPSHQIDARRQQIDARRIMLVNGDGERVELPAGHSLMEVDR